MLPQKLEDKNTDLVAWLPGLEIGDFSRFTKQLTDVVIQTASSQGATREQLIVSQVLNVAEEGGEFAGAYRRYMGFARRAGTREEMLDELSDVVISAMVMFHTLKEDPQPAIKKKLRKILTRGYVNKEAV